MSPKYYLPRTDLNFLKRVYVLALKKIEIASAVAVRLTKYSGKSKTFIHPKHFLEENPWYTKYLDKNDIVLDLGCGNGQSIIKASKYCKKIVGIEIDPNLLKIADVSIKQKSIKNAILQKGNLEEKLLLKSRQFNKVFFLDVFEHLNNRDLILKEIKRVLKPKQALILGVPNSQTSWKKLQRSVGLSSFSDPDHKIEFSEKEIKSLLKRHGFKIISFNYGKYDTPLRGIYDVIGAIYLPAYKKITNWRQKKALKYSQEASGFEVVAFLK